MSTPSTDASTMISRNVRRLRVLHGWTQAEAGKRFGDITGTPWSKAVWSAAEAQTRPRSWTANELAALTELFSVTFDELFAPPGESNCPTCGQQLPDGLTADTVTDEAAPGQKRYRITDEHLQAVVAVYRTAEDQAQPPTLTVATHYEVSHSTAAKWIGHARRAGHLSKWHADAAGGAR